MAEKLMTLANVPKFQPRALLGRVPRGLLATGFLCLWFLVLVDGLLPQLEIFLFGGTVPFPTVLLKFLLFLLVLGGITLKGRWSVPRSILYCWLLFLVYLAFDALVLLVRFAYSLDYLIFSYNACYFYLLLLPGIYVFRGIMQEKTFLILLLSSFIPLACLGIAQYLLNAPLVPVESADGYFKVWSWDFYGQTRAFSLFSSFKNFGFYVSLMAVLLLSLGLATEKRLFRGFLFLGFILACFAVYATLGRGIYGTFCLALLTFFVLRQRKSRLVLWLPLLYLVIGLFQAYGLVPLFARYRDLANLFSDESLAMRFAEWRLWGHEWLGRDATTVLFGAGIIQNDRFPLTQGVIIDNLFLGVGLHIGLIGLVIYLVFIWSLWHEIAVRAGRDSSPVLVAMASWLSTWTYTGVFQLAMAPWLLTACLSQLVVPDRRKKKVARERTGYGSGVLLGESSPGDPAPS